MGSQIESGSLFYHGGTEDSQRFTEKKVLTPEQEA